jgi:general secretion pathway protein G
MKLKQRGFTLLELLVVIVIIGLLAAYVGPKYFNQLAKSQIQITRVQIDGFDKALDQYRLDTTHYPSTEQGLVSLSVQPANEPLWHGPYLKKAVPVDPWGNPYQYRIPATDPNRDFDVVSYGRDGKNGGTGDDADITNWN